MRVHIVGGHGQLGTALGLSAPAGVDIQRFSRSELDLTAIDVEKLAGADVIINAAAYTDVDGAERDPDAAYALNAAGPGELARIAKAQGSHLIHVSTDYVFGAGVERRPLLVDDPKHPNTVYGATKLAGENLVMDNCPDATVVRTAWLFSGDTQPHKDFVSTMLAMARQDREVRVVADQRGNPTFVGDLAVGLWAIVERGVRGILHGVGGGDATWYELAKETYRAAGANPALVSPCATADFPRPAPRPPWSVLDRSTWLAADLPPLPEWRSAVRRAVWDKV